MEVNKIIQGDSLAVLKTLPDELVNCCVTSPPYWGLRDYGTTPQIWDGVEGCEHNFNEYDSKLLHENRQNLDGGTLGNPRYRENLHGFGNAKAGFCIKCGAWKGSLGLEPTFELYIKHLCDIFDQVKRVLRKDGTCWVNLGDSYAGNMGKKNGWTDNKLGYDKQEAIDKGVCLTNKTKFEYTLPQKSLNLIPQRFAIEMVNRGWILRNTIIWHKPNCMPSSAKDRFTVDFEYVYFFVKSKKYWFEQAFEPPYGANGRNKRAVWTIPTKPFPEAHFAVYPEKLIEPTIQAGCPRYVCKKCGKARMKIIDNSERINTRPGLDTGNMKSGKDIDPNKELHNSDLSKYRQQIKYKEIGYTDCGCNAGFEGGIVLDPFSGAGTTAVVAKKQGKQYLGIELKQEYIDMANKRIRAVRELLFV